MDFTAQQIDFMRADLECDMGYSKLIESTKKMFEEQGRDFYGEFIEYAKERGIPSL